MSRWPLPILVGLVVAAGHGCAQPAAEPGSATRLQAPARRALDGVAGRDPELTIRVPADGTVVPWTFRYVDLSWVDGFRCSLFRVRVRAGSEGVAFEAYTEARRLRVAGDDWRRVREAAGEGGDFEVEVVGASVLPDGSVLQGPSRAGTRARFSGEGEHPTGRLSFAWAGRSAGLNGGPGNNLKVNGDSALMEVAMDGEVTPLLPRFTRLNPTAPSQPPLPSPRFPGPELDEVPASGPVRPDGSGPSPTRLEALASRSLDLAELTRQPGDPGWASARRTTVGCLSCHAVSGNGRYLAASTNEDDLFAIPGEDVTGGRLLVLRRDDGAVVRVIGSGQFPRFRPGDWQRMLYARSTSIEEDGERAAMYWTDLHVVDVETGVDVAVPGGSDPHRCETLADWSPDGQSIVFARSRPYEPCEGHRGQMGLAIVPWNDGRGGEPTELTPAGSGAGSDYQPRFSGDGRWVVFVRSERGFYARGSADLWVVAAAGGTEARKLEVSTPAMESFHAFSPDGRWLAFASNRDRVDRPHIYVARFFDDGHTAPALPFPGPGDPEVVAVNPDW